MVTALVFTLYFGYRALFGEASAQRTSLILAIGGVMNLAAGTQVQMMHEIIPVLVPVLAATLDFAVAMLILLEGDSWKRQMVSLLFLGILAHLLLLCGIAFGYGLPYKAHFYLLSGITLAQMGVSSNALLEFFTRVGRSLLDNNASRGPTEALTKRK